MGLRVCGVDLLRSNHGPVVMEVNSSPGLEGIEAATGLYVGDMVLDVDSGNRAGLPVLLVTGGPAVVAEALRTPKKAITAGPGNPPAVVDQTADGLIGHQADRFQDRLGLKWRSAGQSVIERGAE